MIRTFNKRLLAASLSLAVVFLTLSAAFAQQKKSAQAETPRSGSFFDTVLATRNLVDKFNDESC